jgi:hypothetical protein
LAIILKKINLAIDQALPGRVFFFLPLCDVAKLAIIPQEDLAKFGYRSGLKVRLFNDLHSFGHLLEPKREIWRFFENKKTEGVEIWLLEYQKKRISILSPFRGKKIPNRLTLARKLKFKKNAGCLQKKQKEAYRTKEKTVAYRKRNTVAYILPPAVAAAAATTTTTPLPDTNSFSLSRRVESLSARDSCDPSSQTRQGSIGERKKQKKIPLQKIGRWSFIFQTISLSLSLSLLSLIIYTFVFDIHIHQRQQQRLYFVHSGKKQDHKFHSFYCRNKQEPASIAVFVAIKPSPLFFSSFIYRS